MLSKEKPFIFINGSQGHAFSQQLHGQDMPVRKIWVLITVPQPGQVEGRWFFLWLKQRSYCQKELVIVAA